jgi:hypothetical protein
MSMEFAHARILFIYLFILFFVDYLLLFFLWVASIFVLFCLVLLMDGFSSLIFIYLLGFLLHARIIQDTRVYCRFIG